MIEPAFKIITTAKRALEDEKPFVNYLKNVCIDGLNLPEPQPMPSVYIPDDEFFVPERKTGQGLYQMSQKTRDQAYDAQQRANNAEDKGGKLRFGE